MAKRTSPRAAPPQAHPAAWILKTEPGVFSFADLMAARERTTAWEGVRNYQARNFLRAMRRGDPVLIYHSSAEPPGIAGRAEVVREAYPDPTQFDAGQASHDPRSRPSDPTWSAVDVRGIEPLARFLPLDELKADPALATLGVCQRGSRLSVHPVQAGEWRAILALAKRKSRS